MKDRQPTRPGRVKITPENGAAYYAVMEMADEPTEVGTPPTKANLLKDTTAALFGGDENMVPDDALVALKTLIDGLSAESIGAAKIATGSYTGTGAFYYQTSKYKNSITFPFVPKVVYVTIASGIAGGTNNGVKRKEMLVVNGMTQQASVVEQGASGGSTGYICLLEWNENTLSWYYESNYGAQYQLNESRVEYKYFALG